jgi:hypothetical protein
MGREFVRECPGSGNDPESDDLEAELAIKYIKQACGRPPRGADVQVTLEGHDLGSYSVVSVVWDDSVTYYPGEYIGKCIEAFEHFDLPEDVYERYQALFDLQAKLEELIQERLERRSEELRLRYSSEKNDESK